MEISFLYLKKETGAPGGSRTHDLWLRKPTLYPTELRAQARDYTKITISSRSFFQAFKLAGIIIFLLKQ